MYKPLKDSQELSNQELLSIALGAVVAVGCNLNPKTYKKEVVLLRKVYRALALIKNQPLS